MNTTHAQGESLLCTPPEAYSVIERSIIRIQSFSVDGSDSPDSQATGLGTGEAPARSQTTGPDCRERSELSVRLPAFHLPI